MHDRTVCLLRKQSWDRHVDRARYLAAEAAAAVLGDDHDLRRVDPHLPRDAARGSLGRLHRRMDVEFATLPVGHTASGLERMMSLGLMGERLVENKIRFLKPFLNVTDFPLFFGLAHR